jgi:hypothetical protein
MCGSILPGSSVHKLLAVIVLPCGCDPLMSCRVMYVEARARITHACPRTGQRCDAGGRPVVEVTR